MSATQPPGVDFLQLDALLTPEQRHVRDAVRQFVDNEFRPQIRTHHRAGTFPTELRRPLAELGVFGANLKGYGCPGLDEFSYGLICQELERGDSGLRSFVSVQGALAMYAIWAFGDETQKEALLPAMAKGEKLGCFGLTEHDSGSDPGGMATRARPDGDGYILDGVKMWITNGSVADIAVVWARTGDDARSIRGFIVPLDRPGVEIHEVEGKLSLRASITSELVFDGVRLGKEALLPSSAGLKSALACLTQARYGIVWGTTGAAMDCYESVRSYQLERRQFDRPLASFQIQQQKLVSLMSAITTSQLINHRLAQLKTEGVLTPQQVSFGKRHNVSAARDVARTAREMMGANGILDAYPVMRHLMNLETVYTYEGTHDIHTLVLGRAITGLNAFA